MTFRPVDTLSTCHLSTTTTKTTAAQPTRYAIRQVLDQELRKEKILQASLSRQARGNGVMNPSHPDIDKIHSSVDKENIQPTANMNVPLKAVKVKRDFFGRPIHSSVFTPPSPETVPDGTKIDASTIAKATAFKGKAKTKAKGTTRDEEDGDEHGRIWVSFHEGFSNAVRKPISLGDLLEGF